MTSLKLDEVQLKKIFIILLIFVVLVAAFSGCSAPQVSQKLKVGVTIYPFFDAVKSIGGDLVDVVLIVPVGSSPHDYTVTPNDIKNLEDAKVIFENGFGLEAFLTPILNSVNTEVVNVSEGLSDVVAKHDGNPHLWLNPQYFVLQSAVIKDALCKLDPQNAILYEKNYESYQNAILLKAEALRKEVSQLENRNLITFHDAFPYFAEYFGLNILASVETDPNRLPTPKDILDIESLIKKYHIGVVFKEPQLSPDIYKSIVEDTGVTVVSLDPLGGGTIKMYNDVIEYNVDTIIDALSNE